MNMTSGLFPKRMGVTMYICPVLENNSVAPKYKTCGADQGTDVQNKEETKTCSSKVQNITYSSNLCKTNASEVHVSPKYSKYKNKRLISKIHTKASASTSASVENKQKIYN